MTHMFRWPTTLQLILAGLVIASVSEAQEMPTPRGAPRTAVSRQEVLEHAPLARQVTGQALVVDGEKLHINDMDLRLYGVVPPQLSASFGPQARAALDSLINGQPITCQVRDRDRDGRLLATCHTAGGGDPALELLRRGLAVSARGSLNGSDLAPSYLAAEQAAQNQHLGLWSVAVPAAAPQTSTAPVVTAESKSETKAETKTDSQATDAKPDQHKIDKPVTEPHTVPVTVHTSYDARNPDDSFYATPVTVAAMTANQPGFFATYQILITGILMLGTAFGIMAALTLQKIRDKRDELKAMGAALRGELLAARAVCHARLKTIRSDEEDRATPWPRIRATLYQAYVGRIGILGAELARQITSIYGQTSDYAAYYNAAEGTNTSTTPKRSALEKLVSHIDDVLPRLATIEMNGSLSGQNQDMVKAASTSSKQPSVRQPAPKTVATPPKSELPITHTEAVLDHSSTILVETIEDSSPPQPVGNANGFWSTVKQFARGALRTTETAKENHEGDVDYTTLIEEDMAKYALSQGEESLDISPTPSTSTAPPASRTGT